MIKNVPPMGVIAPNHLIPDIDNKNKLPENRMMPITNIQIDKLKSSVCK